MVRFVPLLVGLAFFGCTPSKEYIPERSGAEVRNHKVIIYQVLTRLFANDHGSNQVNGTVEQNGVGKFNGITNEALRSIRQLGITHIWYTGVIEHSQMRDYSRYGIKVDDADVVKGRAGSPYAIKDYYDVDPDLAENVPSRMKEFEQLLQRTHANEMKVIIDFVPNHVARTYASDAKPDGVRDLGAFDDKTVAFKPGNNFYYLLGTSFKVPEDYNPLDSLTFPTEDGKYEESPAKASGNDQFTDRPGMNEWFETVKLNYGIDVQGGGTKHFDPIPNTWMKMRDILIFWTKKGVDGFRCDMAQMVPVEFWGWAIPQVKAVNPDVIFIAEIYEPSLYRSYLDDGRFDFLYDKVQLYDTLRRLVTGSGSTRGIGAVQGSLIDINDRMLHFMENHDEQRIASPFFAGDPWRARPAMVVSAAVDPGPLMIYFGQELGERAEGREGFAGDDGRTTIHDYWKVPSISRWVETGYTLDSLTEQQRTLRGFYQSLLKLSRDNQAIVDGDYVDLTPGITPNTGGKVFAFLRTKDSESIVGVASFASYPELIQLKLPSEIPSDTSQYVLSDLLKQDVSGTINGNSLQLTIPPYGAYILKMVKK